MSADFAFRLTGFGSTGTKPPSGTGPTDAAGPSSFGGLLDTMTRATSAVVAPGAAAGPAAAKVARQSAVALSQPQIPEAGATIPTPGTMSRRSAAPQGVTDAIDEDPEASDTDPETSDATPTTVGAGTVDVAALAQAVWLATSAAAAPPPPPPPSAATPQGLPAVAANQAAPGSSPTLAIAAAASGLTNTPAVTDLTAVPAPANSETTASAPAGEPGPSPSAPLSAAFSPGTEAQAAASGPVPASALPASGPSASVPPASVPPASVLPAPVLPAAAAAPALQPAPAVPPGSPGIEDQGTSGAVAATTAPKIANQAIASPPASSIVPKAAAVRPLGAKPAAPVHQLSGPPPLPAPLPVGAADARSGTGTTHGGSQDQGSSDQGTAAPDAAAQDPSAAPSVTPTIAQVDLTAASQVASASQQVVSALSSLAGPAVAGPVTSDAVTPGASGPMAPPGTVRTLPDGSREVVVKLDPEHLGSVSIRLTMTGSKVEVSITVSDAHTLDILNRDRHVLSAAVSSAGLAGSGLTLAHGSSDTGRTASASPTSDGQQGTMPDGRGSASASEDPSGNHRRRDPRPTSSAMLDDVGEAASPSASAKRSGALYV